MIAKGISTCRASFDQGLVFHGWACSDSSSNLTRKLRDWLPATAVRRCIQGKGSHTVRFLPKEPSLTEFSGTAEGAVAAITGGTPTYEAGIAEGGPIVPDQLGFRFSLWDRHDGGYIDRMDMVTGNVVQRDFNTDDRIPNQRDPSKPMSNGAILMALKRMGYQNRMTGHGFRALAMSTIKEQLGYRHEVVDRQLAHAQKDKVVAAYDRAQFLDERKKMMQHWADYLDAIAADGKVIAANFAKSA